LVTAGCIDQNQHTADPYQSAIDVMDSLTRATSPSQICKLFKRVMEEIENSIDKYYHNIPLEKKIYVCTDDICPLLIYIITKLEETTIRQLPGITFIIYTFLQNSSEIPGARKDNSGTTAKSYYSGLSKGKACYFLTTLKGCMYLLRNDKI